MPKIDIDFARAAALMDVVQKVASVVPSYTPLSSVALNELKEMNDRAAEIIAELGRERLRKEQEEAAKLTEANQKVADEEALLAARKEFEKRNRPVVKPINVMPGEPDELPQAKERLKAQEPDVHQEPRRI